MWDLSSSTRDQTHIPCIGRLTASLWGGTREAPQSLHFWWTPNRYQKVLSFCSLPRYDHFPPPSAADFGLCQGVVPAEHACLHTASLLPACVHAHTSHSLINPPPPRSQHWLVEGIWRHKNFHSGHPGTDFFPFCWIQRYAVQIPRCHGQRVPLPLATDQWQSCNIQGHAPSWGGLYPMAERRRSVKAWASVHNSRPFWMATLALKLPRASVLLGLEGCSNSLPPYFSPPFNKYWSQDRSLLSTLFNKLIVFPKESNLNQSLIFSFLTCHWIYFS